MLEKTADKDIYNALLSIDVTEYLRNFELVFDYFIASDVFIYVGLLSEIFKLIKSRNKRSGKFTFSIKHANDFN